MNELSGDFGKPTASAIEKALELDKTGKGRRKRRIVLWLVFSAIALGGIAWGVLALTAKPAAVSYRTEAAAIGDLVIEVSATGVLSPLTKVDVSTEMSGVVREVNFDENQRVKKGDVLLTLDATRLTAQVDRARANVKSAEAQLANSRTALKDAASAFERSRTLAKRGLVSEQDLANAQSAKDRAESAILISEAALAVAEAELKLQEADLAKSTIYAPIDGMVLTRSVDPGQTVAASLSAPVLFVIAENLERMQLDAAIDEADIGAAAKGQTAKFKVDAWPDKAFTATIADLAYASTLTDGVVSYKGTLAVDNSELLLRPGMTATVDIIVREAKSVITIANSAFRFAPPKAAPSSGFSITSMFMPRFPRSSRNANPVAEDGTRTIYVLESGEPVARKVKTGATDGEKTEITSGLNDGEEVILSIVQAAK